MMTATATATAAEPRPGNLTANGWSKIARDLDRAFGVARFSGTESFLIQIAREESWVKSSGEPRPFRLDLAAISAETSVPAKSLREAHAALVAKRIFVAEDRSFRINKDYREWVDATGSPLLSPAQIRYAAAAATLRSGDSWRRKTAVGAAENRRIEDDARRKTAVETAENRRDYGGKPPRASNRNVRGIESIESKRENSPLTPQGGTVAGELAPLPEAQEPNAAEPTPSAAPTAPVAPLAIPSPPPAEPAMPAAPTPRMGDQGPSEAIPDPKAELRERADWTREQVERLVTTAPGGNAILAETGGKAAWSQVFHEGYPASEVLSAWGRAIDGSRTPRNWAATVNTNLGNRQARHKQDHAEIAAEVEKKKRDNAGALPDRVDIASLPDCTANIANYKLDTERFRYRRAM